MDGWLFQQAEELHTHVFFLNKNNQKDAENIDPVSFMDPANIDFRVAPNP